MVRSARPDEAADLTELALRWKAHWGYDAAFVDATREVLSLDPGTIEHEDVQVAHRAGTILGFYRLRLRPPNAWLDDLAAEPGKDGTELARDLWSHATARARDAGCTRLTFDADPRAASFFHELGARRVGERESYVFEGRMLPVMEAELSEVPSLPVPGGEDPA
jgi:GNAT superfamily N-acetyltransferase